MFDDSVKEFVQAPTKMARDIKLENHKFLKFSIFSISFRLRTAMTFDSHFWWSESTLAFL